MLYFRSMKLKIYCERFLSLCFMELPFHFSTDFLVCNVNDPNSEAPLGVTEHTNPRCPCCFILICQEPLNCDLYKGIYRNPGME